MDKVKTSLQNFGNNVSESFSSAGTFCSESYFELKSKINTYFESKSYEEDLDAIIEGLHAHTDKRPKFEFSEDLKSRLEEKKKYLLKQAGLFVGGSALTGAWAAIEQGNFAMIGEYSLIGACGAVIVIVITASGVFLKRVKNSTKSGADFSTTASAFHSLKARLS